jgi:hypothetical protein
MKDNLDKDKEKQKKAIFNGMSPRRRQRILEKVGYENWDPFQAPKDPLDLRDRKSDLIATDILREFVSDHEVKNRSNEYIQGLKEISKGLLKGEEKCQAIYDFCCWYKKKKQDPLP